MALIVHKYGGTSMGSVERIRNVAQRVAKWHKAGHRLVVVPSAMSKAGVAVMTQSLAVEWARHGIRLNAIAPGPFPTEGAWARLNPMQEGDDNRYNTRNPMGRVGRPSELANMAAFLMSEEVEYINGEVIAIDGAMGIMGNGTFSHMMSYSEQDWVRIREQIQSTNAADKVKRS